MKPATRDRIERLSNRLAFVVAMCIVVFLLGPLLVVLVTGFIRGVATGEWPANGGMGWEPGFPPFDPQLWLMWIPIAALTVWIIVTIPVPLKRSRGRGRFLQAMFWLMTTVLAITLIAGYSTAPWIQDPGSAAALNGLLLVGAVLALRVILGALRLLPRSWRMYLDADGHPEPPQSRGPSPLAGVPQ